MKELSWKPENLVMLLSQLEIGMKYDNRVCNLQVLQSCLYLLVSHGIAERIHITIAE